MACDDTLLFCHVPKAAGTSLRRALQAAYPDLLAVYAGELKLDNPDAGFVDRFRALPRRPAVVYGHFSFGVHRVLDVAPRYATFVRDPVRRVVSLYRQQAADPDAEFHSRIRRGMSLHEFVACGETEMTNNHVCRILAGVPPEPGCRLNEESLLGEALDNVRRHFLFVGCVERYGESVRKLAALLGVELDAASRENVSSGSPPDADPATLELIETENALDRRLYDRLFGDPASSRS